MKTIIQKVNPEYFEDSELEAASRILQTGGLVAFPTETVYGLGGNALLPRAAQRIYAAKGRPSDNPLIVHIAEMDHLFDLAEEVSDKALALAETFWPGPLTMIFPKKESVPASTTGGLRTVAVRMPNHPIAAALIRQSGVYIAAPSANLSGRPSPTKAEHVIEDLEGRIELILDGGRTGIGIESTIVDMSGDMPVILRPGFYTKIMLEGVIGRVSVDPAVLLTEPKEDITAKAPGMKYRHYAPKGQLTVVEGDMERVVAKINALTEEHQSRQEKAVVIATEESRQFYISEHVYSIGSRKTEGSIAAGLYDILRLMDHIGAEFIYIESFSEDTLGSAIMNRLLKAAGYHRIQV